MSGLREHKKEGRRQRILDAAREHFRDRGFDATTIEMIAESADVSAVTVYNHYRTKGGVLLALVTRSDDLLIGKIEALMDIAQPDPLDGIVSFSQTINEHAFSYLNREIWRHVIATSILEGNTEFGAVYRRLDQTLIEQLERFLKRFEALSADCDCQTAAEVLYNVHNARFLEFIIDRTRTREARDRLTRRDLAFVLGRLG